MFVPPDLALEPVILTTNAAANLSKTDVVLAAPGAGLRYRIWAWNLGMRQQAPAGVGLNAYLRDVGRQAFLSCSSGGGSSSGSDHYDFAGGYAFPENTAVSVETFCSAAGEGYRVTIAYTIEPV